MKSYDGVTHTNLTAPSGVQFPERPQTSEIFHLLADMPDMRPDVPGWCSAGMYYFDGAAWQKLVDPRSRQRTVVIGSFDHEVEAPCSITEPPTTTGGLKVCEVYVRPSNRKATITGIGTLSVDLSKSGNVLISVYRETLLVGLTLQHITAGQLQNVSISFYDIPSRVQNFCYQVHVHADVAGMLYVNRGSRLTVDGHGRTVFTVTENI